MQPATRPKRRRTARRLALLCTLATAISFGAVELADAANGAPSGGRHWPAGHVNRLRQSATGLFLSGWAYDADTARSALVRISIDHHRLAEVVANRYRPDVGRKRPGYGNWRGFRLNTAVPAGIHTICVRIVDYPSDRSRRLLCRSMTFDFSPFGTITSLTQRPGQLTATGWAIDPNRPATARGVVAYVDNVAVARGVARHRVAGLTASHPSAGARHGYTVSFPVTEGTHRICIWASNIGPGHGRNIACITRAVSFSPSGRITRLDQIPGGFAVHGYAIDPDTSAATTVTVTVNGIRLAATPANRLAGSKPGHWFYAKYLIPTATLPAGNRTVCVIAKNLGVYGKDRNIQCVTRYLNWNPVAGVNRVVQKWPGAWVSGWAVDPDTSAPINAALYADGKYVMTVPAKGTGGDHSGHMVRRVVPLPDGKHTLCIAGVNVRYGTGTPARSCKTITLNFRPTGTFGSLARGAKNAPSPAVVTGTARDPDTPGSIPVQARVDSGAWVTGQTNASTHAYRFSAPAADGEHSVCVRALDVTPTGARTGATTSLGCKILNAIHPVPPAAPRGVTAVAGYGGARITWTAPASDGGAPWTGYTVAASPGGLIMTVGPRTTAVTMLGLKPSTRYSFSVVAKNVAGRSRPGTSPVVTTEKEPPPQTSPAPISTSRYIRNVYGASSTDLATMRAEGAADAAANPSGHGYLIVLAV
ncbi:MAG TPA: fibronectin type III domain-containing protein, partial [Jatrophihabitantaceae bacterium]